MQHTTTRGPARILATAFVVGGLLIAPAALAQEVLECNTTAEATHHAEMFNGAAATAAINAIQGKVSYYGRELRGRRTAAGERFDPGAHTMAHRTLPFGTRVRVTNLLNNISVIVRVNDRGPFTGGRVGDVSAGAAQALGMLRDGVVDALLEVLHRVDTPKLE